ncbi:MAG: choice-of-anchor J domain-containing protein [Muribaculaceae bacterium]|nr:choice-of-anchor J domain-containing protein [Muribaculaceae bacterium]
MKKIYILTAVFALLALSLNAQTQLKVGKDGVVVDPNATTVQVVKGEKEVIPDDGNIRKAPSRASDVPVTPPYTNSFSSNDDFGLMEVIDANDDNRTWSRNTSGYAQYQYSGSNAANDWLVTAPVYLEAGKVYTFSINAWIRQYSNTDYERLEVRMAKDVHTAEALSVGKIVIPYTNVTSTSNSNSFSNTKVRVNETGYYYFGIHAVSPANMYYLCVDNLNIGIGADPVHDLKAYVSAPTQVYAGQKATVDVKVTNLGDFAETGYTVKIYANGNEISSETVNESLLLGASKMFSAEYTTVAAEAYTSVNFTATVTCANTDADGTNNSATASMAVLAAPAPVNVAATDGDGNSTVTWEAPNISSITVTEDFENLNVFPSFGLGGITATVHTGAFGDWTLYDNTGANVYGSNQEDWENEQAPQAWMPFDPIAIESATTTHSGEQFIESVCPASSTIAADSWLISPELSGNAQTITFYERVITSAYGDETYEVWASSTDNNPESFTKVKDFSDANLDWTQQSAELPAGTKYFAIRHTSKDIFGLLIDDITYEVAGEQPVSYNVYLDNNLVGNVNANTLSYNLTNVPYGEHTCSISAVYAGNIESALVSDPFASGPKTATPTITYTETNGTVVITATGEGTITLEADGQTAIGNDGIATITIVKSPEARTVTATATAKAEGKAESDPATETIPIPVLTGTNTEPAEGLLRLHMLIVDQLKEPIPADNSHPEHYGYVLRYEPTGGEKKESSSVRVDIQKTDCTVEGKYTLDQIDNDTDRGLTMGIYSADVNFDLTDDNPDVDFYMLERENSKDTDPSFSYVTKLQQTTNFTYVEMLPGSANEGEEYPAGTHYFNDEVLTGAYGDYVRYAPVVSTWGVDRRYYEDDALDNTYGAPLWKTGVAEVTMISADIEPQDNAWHSVTWTDEDGPARLYILDKVQAVGKLPDYSTVKYEPYMFRIFVESPSGKLRNYKVVAGTDDQGEHLDASATSEVDKKGPRCVWSGYIKDIPETTTENNPYGMMLGISGNEYTFTKNKVDRTGTSHDGGIGNEDWDKDDVNAMFGALTSIETGDNQNISVDDIKVFVRFYYNVKGMAAGHEATSNNDRSLRAEDETHPGYGAESDAKAPKQTPTSVFEIAYHGEIVSQTYYNVQGMESDKPFEGINIVVTRYSDGSVVTTKVVR